jgi:antitoxin ParD1/3/4
MATTLNVRVNGPLEEFIAENIGEQGLYENASEYVRHLIRQDRERVEQARFEELRAELQRAFATPDEEYIELDAETFLARAKERWSK